MANSGTGSAALGIGGIGFGVLLLWAAFKNVPLFGPNGVMRSLVSSGSLDRTAATAGKLASQQRGTTSGGPVSV